MYTYVSESGWRTRYTLQSAMVNKQRTFGFSGRCSLKANRREWISQVLSSKMYFSRACIVSRRWNARRSRRSTSFSTKNELWLSLFFSLRSTIFVIEGILFSLSLSFASSWRSFRPAIEKSREIGNVSDPVYGLSLQRFAIECRLYIVLLYVYYLYMYIYIY